MFDFFISNAYAQGAGAGGMGEGLMSMWPFLAMFVAMYFLMIRPQMKKQKETRAMLDAVAKGDEVVTVGGIVGRISQMGDQYVTLEIASGTEMIVQKSSISMPLPKGTMKSLGATTVSLGKGK